MMRYFLLLMTGFACFASSLQAQDAGRTREIDAQQPPVSPPQVDGNESLEPEVTIIQRDSQTIKEYRINGQLYMVKIVPQAGPSYYLLDTDGDGQLDAERDSVSNISIPQWVLFKW